MLTAYCFVLRSSDHVQFVRHEVRHGSQFACERISHSLQVALHDDGKASIDVLRQHDATDVEPVPVRGVEIFVAVFMLCLMGAIDSLLRLVQQGGVFHTGHRWLVEAALCSQRSQRAGGEKFSLRRI